MVSDFAETMMDWTRLCDSMDKKYSDDCCKNCPLCGFGCGGIFEMPKNTDWRLLQEKVAAWAAENPEPVYPTFKEWLIDIGVLGNMTTYNIIAEKITTTHIPADIAEKLGLKPKGGNENG